MPVPNDFNQLWVRAAAATPDPFSSASTGIATQTQSRTTTRLSSTSRNTAVAYPSSTSSSPAFRWPTLAAIVLPILVVLSIASVMYRRWRRSQATCAVVVVPEPPPPAPPKQHAWNEPQAYNMPPRPISTFQQHFVENTSYTQPPPVPTITSHWENTAPNPVWGQSGQDGYNPQAHYDASAYHPAPMRHPSTISSNNRLGSSYPPELLEESRRAEMGAQPTRYPSTIGSQSQPGRPPYTPHMEESRRRETEDQSHNFSRDQWGNSSSGQVLNSPSRVQSPGWNPQTAGSSSMTHPPVQSTPEWQGSTAPPVSSNPRENNSPVREQDVLRQKGEVVLTWNTTSGPTPVEQQHAGPSGSQADNQPDTPELHMLRERVQRLEAALDDRAPPVPQNDEPDRPPPAYDFLPTVEPTSASGQNSSGQGRRPS